MTSVVMPGTTWPRLVRAVCLIGLSALALGDPALAAPKPELDPFEVHPDSIRGRVDRMALMPVNQIGATWVPQPDTVLAPMFRSRLEAGGHGIVPADSVLACWRAAAAVAGGIFDRRTGRPDSARVRVAVAAFMAALRDTFGVNTVWRYGLTNVSAEWDGSKAKWDGQTQVVGSPGLISTLLSGGQKGKIGALSLYVVASDTDVRALYRNRAGLASLSLMVKDRWVDVPQETIVADTSITRPAVDRVVAPWLGRISRKMN